MTIIRMYFDRNYIFYSKLESSLSEGVALKAKTAAEFEGILGDNNIKFDYDLSDLKDK